MVRSLEELEAFCDSECQWQKLFSGIMKYILRWTMPGPISSYSCLLIHKFWNVDNDPIRQVVQHLVFSENIWDAPRIDPPIQTEYLRSGGATTLTFIEDGARSTSSFRRRSAMPGNMVVPPDITTLPYLWIEDVSERLYDWIEWLTVHGGYLMRGCKWVAQMTRKLYVPISVFMIESYLSRR